jgi:hypothetical protein
MLMWLVISPHFRNLFFMATTRYGIYYFSTFNKMGLFHVRQGLGGKLSDFYIFYCMVIELDICSTFYAAKLMCFWWLLKINKIRRGKITILNVEK